MRKTLLIAIAFATVFAGCKKDKESDGGTDDPFKLEYSNLPVEQQKKKVEDAGIAFVQKVNSLPDEKFVDVLDYLAGLEFGLDLEEESSVTSVLSINSAAKKKDIKGLFKASTSAASEIARISDAYKIYTWNHDTEEWDQEDATDKLEIQFPSDASKTSNNAVITLTYTASNVTGSIEDESAELPATATISLKVDNKEELKLTSSYEYKTDGTPTKADISLVLGSFKLTTKASNNGKEASSELAFTKGTETLLSFKTSGSGNMILDEASEADDFTEIVQKGNVSFEIMNISMVGQMDFKGIADANDAIPDNTSSSDRTTKEVEAFNKYTKLVALNKDDNSLLAKIVFEKTTEVNGDCNWYWDPQTQNYFEECTDGFYVEPKLVFKDGSPISFESFTDNSLTNLIEELEDFTSEFE